MRVDRAVRPPSGPEPGPAAQPTLADFEILIDQTFRMANLLDGAERLLTMGLSVFDSHDAGRPVAPPLWEELTRQWLDMLRARQVLQGTNRWSSWNDMDRVPGRLRDGAIVLAMARIAFQVLREGLQDVNSGRGEQLPHWRRERTVMAAGGLVSAISGLPERLAVVEGLLSELGALGALPEGELGHVG